MDHEVDEFSYPLGSVGLDSPPKSIGLHPPPQAYSLDSGFCASFYHASTISSTVICRCKFQVVDSPVTFEQS